MPNLSFMPCVGGPSTYSPHICFLHLLVPWFQCQWAAALDRGPPAACSDPTHGPLPPGASDAPRSRPESSTPYRSAHRWTGAAPQRYSTLTWRDLREVTGWVRITLHAVCYLHSVLTCVHHFVHWCCIILPLHFKKQAEFCIIIIIFLLLLLLLLFLKWKKWTCSKLTLGWVSIEMRSLMTPHPSWSNDCNNRKTLIICWWIMWEMRLINKHGENHTWIEWNPHSCWNCFQRDCSSETLWKLWQHTCNSCDIKYTHPSLLRNADRVDLCPQSVPKITSEPVCFGRFFVP